MQELVIFFYVVAAGFLTELGAMYWCKRQDMLIEKAYQDKADNLLGKSIEQAARDHDDSYMKSSRDCRTTEFEIHVPIPEQP